MPKSTVKKLRQCANLSDFACLIGYKPKTLAYILYHLEVKYSQFEIQKSNGKTRTITAPVSQLRLLQQRTSALLYQCTKDVRTENPKFGQFSHGFEKERTIITNTKVHSKRSFVFNTDIEHYFDQFNFGRVRGYFIKNSRFKVSEKVATIIAQICCHDNKLPQGAPTSPIVSNLISYSLDKDLSVLSKKYGFYYTRYADDLTFSTNNKKINRRLCRRKLLSKTKWIAGSELLKAVSKNGFKLNAQKHRAAYDNSRQTVTGLTANEYPNISSDYYNLVRAQCHHLFDKGYYFEKVGTKSNGKPKLRTIRRTNILEGKISHIYSVKSKHHAFDSKKSSILTLYKRFFTFTHFINAERPTIITEGITDITYLRCALRKIGTKFPLLYSRTSQPKYLTKFFSASKRQAVLTNLTNGTGGMPATIEAITNYCKNCAYIPKKHPVIFLLDHDGGLNALKQKLKKDFNIDITTEKDFYHLFENIYVVVLKKIGSTETAIEDLFSTKELSVKIDGKTFSKSNKLDEKTRYGKLDFSEKVVRANYSKIDFLGFEPLLKQISDCIAFHQTSQKPPTI